MINYLLSDFRLMKNLFHRVDEIDEGSTKRCMFSEIDFKLRSILRTVIDRQKRNV